MALGQIVARGRRSPNPRHWMRATRRQPGTCFVYWSGRPSVCAIVGDGAVVTVVTRQLCESAPRHLPEPGGRPRPQVVPFRWSGLLEEAA